MATTPFPAPPAGDRVRQQNGKLVVPDNPVIPFIEGDGIGPDIWAATRRVLDAAIEKVSGGKRGIIWYEVFAGEKAYQMFGEWLPASGEEVAEAPCLECYLNDCHQLPAEQWLTDLCIPLQD